MPKVRVTRRLHFAAAHRLCNAAFDDAQNRAVFGACSNPSWLDGVNPTAENVAVRIWHRIDSHLEGARLVSGRLWETERNLVEYCGE